MASNVPKRKDDESSDVKAALKLALERNLEFQCEVKKNIIAISKKKAENRRRSQELMAFLFTNWCIEDERKTPATEMEPDQYFQLFYRKLRKKKIAQNLTKVRGK